MPLEELGLSLEKLHEQHEWQLRTLQDAMKAAGTKERETLLQAHHLQLSRLLQDITEKVPSFIPAITRHNVTDAILQTLFSKATYNDARIHLSVYPSALFNIYKMAFHLSSPELHLVTIPLTEALFHGLNGSREWI